MTYLQPLGGMLDKTFVFTGSGDKLYRICLQGLGGTLDRNCLQNLGATLDRNYVYRIWEESFVG